MASIRIDCNATLASVKMDVMEAVQGALLGPFELRADQNDVVITCHASGDRLLPQKKSQDFCLVEVKTLAGKSDEQKRTARTAICAALSRFEVAPDDIKMIVIDVAPENLGR